MPRPAPLLLALFLLNLVTPPAPAQENDNQTRAFECIEAYYRAIETEDPHALATLFQVDDEDESRSLLRQHEIMFEAMDLRVEDLHFLDWQPLGTDRAQCSIALHASISPSGRDSFLPKREENLFLLQRNGEGWKILTIQRKLVLDLHGPETPDALRMGDSLSSPTRLSLQRLEQAESDMMRLLDQADLRSSGSLAAAHASMLEERHSLDQNPDPDARERYHHSRERLIELLEASPETWSAELQRSHRRYLEAREAYQGNLLRDNETSTRQALARAEMQYRDALENWLDLMESANVDEEELEAARRQYEQAREELQQRRRDAPPEATGSRWF